MLKNRLDGRCFQYAGLEDVPLQGGGLRAGQQRIMGRRCRGTTIASQKCVAGILSGPATRKTLGRMQEDEDAAQGRTRANSAPAMRGTPHQSGVGSKIETDINMSLSRTLRGDGTDPISRESPAAATGPALTT